MPAAGAGPRGERRLTAAREALVAAVRTPADLDELPLRHAAAADAFLGGLLEDACAGDPSGLCLVAVGGYGRRELHPGSDLDVVLVHRQRRDVAEVAQRLWYPVWDDGTPLDHSVRSVREALAVAREDLRAALGLLDARVVAGDPGPGEELARRAVEALRARARDFLPELDAAVRARYDQHGELAFLLEPDLKEARGGLRDVHALAAAAVAAPALAPSLGLDALAEPAALLRRVRTALHARTRRRGDRLLLEEQDDVARLAGYDDADALMGAVAGAARTIGWAADDGWRRVRSFVAGPRGRAGVRDRPLAAGIVLRDGEIAVTEAAGDALLLVRAAAVAASEGHPFSAGLLERLSAPAPAVPEPWPDELRHAFLTVLGGRERAVEVLEALDQVRFLERLIPEWAAVRNRPQRNAYHRFTVDRHLIETVARAGLLVRTVARPDLLLVAALLHDIGKGFPGDHTEVGTRLAPLVAERMGLVPEDAALVGRLVQHHLLLAETATRRDLDDPATVAAVAGAVGDLPTLELLAALARADGEATGPAAWGRWKEGLVDELVRRVAAALAPPAPAGPAPAGGGPSGPAGASGPAGGDVGVADHAGGGQLRPRAGADESLAPELEEALRAGRLAVAAAGDGTLASVTVVAPDRPGLLATVAGVLALHGLAVRRATAVGRESMAIEHFHVEPGPAGAPQAARLLADLAAAEAGTLLLEARLAELARAYAGGRPGMPARDVAVRVDNAASERATLVEVRAPDARGLLRLLARTLSDQGLDVASAHVSTLGHEVVDAFYVTLAGDPPGRKLVDPAAVERLRQALVTAAAS